MRKLYIADTEIFQDKFEASLASGTYLWIDDNHILYDETRHDILWDIDFEDLTEYTPIEIIQL